MRSLNAELSIHRAGVGCQGGLGGELAGAVNSAESRRGLRSASGPIRNCDLIAFVHHVVLKFSVRRSINSHPYGMCSIDLVLEDLRIVERLIPH